MLAWCGGVVVSAPTSTVCYPAAQYASCLPGWLCGVCMPWLPDACQGGVHACVPACVLGRVCGDRRSHKKRVRPSGTRAAAQPAQHCNTASAALQTGVCDCRRLLPRHPAGMLLFACSWLSAYGSFWSRGRREPHIALGWCVVAVNVRPQLPAFGLVSCGVVVCVRASAVCACFPAAQHATASIRSCIMGRLVGQHAAVLKPSDCTRST